MGLPAARLTDGTLHGGRIVLGKFNVLIGKRPAARITDIHLCPPVHWTGPILPPCAFNVLIGMLPAARITDKLVCGCGVPDIIVTGEFTVLIGTQGPIVTGLGSLVDDLIARSPRLTAQMQALLAGGWTIVPGPAGGGSYADRTNKQIVVESGQSTVETVLTLAHEAGHAGYKPAYHQPTGLTRQQYVSRNTNECLKDEGEAIINEGDVGRETRENGNYNLGHSGARAQDYGRINGEVQAGRLTRDQGRQQIGTLVGQHEITSTTGQNYTTYYSQAYINHANTIGMPP